MAHKRRAAAMGALRRPDSASIRPHAGRRIARRSVGPPLRRQALRVDRRFVAAASQRRLRHRRERELVSLGGGGAAAPAQDVRFVHAGVRGGRAPRALGGARWRARLQAGGQAGPDDAAFRRAGTRPCASPHTCLCASPHTCLDRRAARLRVDQVAPCSCICTADVAQRLHPATTGCMRRA